MVSPPAPRRAHAEDAQDVALTDWELAAAAPGELEAPGGLEAAPLSWLPARVPGTVAAALAAAAIPSEGRDLDAEDWWFRCSFEAPPAEGGEHVTLELGGIATRADVFLNGEAILASESMFASHSIDVGAALAGRNELAIRCHALGPLLAQRRRPRARWRTRLVAEGNLRFFRTMLLGRAPGFAPGPPVVGPWRPVRLRRHARPFAEGVRIRARLEGADGLLSVAARLRTAGAETPGSAAVELEGPSGTHRADLALTPCAGGAEASGEIRIPGVAAWWPHTHGPPALHEVRLLGAGDRILAHRRVGFRELRAGVADDHVPERDGLDLHVNGTRIFARGAVWTPLDPAGMAPSPAELRAALEAARDAGMNMLRIPGTSAYESAAFHDLCDELGILLWQDFAFANLDYPIADGGFRGLVEAEARQVLASLAGRPSLAVLCGNSEVEQQAAMFGADPELGRGELFGELLPALVSESGTDAIYVPSSPCGGDLPFRPGAGIANYYGVGGYRRPLEDARRSAVRFAGECLAFANVPREEMIEAMMAGDGAAVGDPRWKAGVPRDVGAGWDFDDVRDHYLELLFGVDPVGLRSVDPKRYLELSRAVSGEVMAEVFGEWRRRDSVCGGGLVLWMRDLRPGAGWGLLDSEGEPKVALHHLRRALAPRAIWTTDEGLGGIDVHVANDRGDPLAARVRVALYRDGEQRVAEAVETVAIPARGGWSTGVERMLGRFVDAANAYGFGPPAQDLIVASLEREGAGGELISQAFRHPAGRPSGREPAERLGLVTETVRLSDGRLRLTVGTRRLAYGVRIHAPGWRPRDDAFSVEPGGERTITLVPRGGESPSERLSLSALNLEGRVSEPIPPEHVAE